MKFRIYHTYMNGFICAVVLYISGTAHADPAPRIITNDWTIAETLNAMGMSPIGLGDYRAYRSWVVQPNMPPYTIDIGLRSQPNLELIKVLQPDWVINASWLPPLPDRFLQTDTRVQAIDFYGEQGISWAQAQRTTLELGQLIHKKDAANQLINQATVQFAEQKKLLANYSYRPFAIVQFIDARHLRIYGHNSMFDATLQELGLKNAWQGDTTAWGSTNIDIIELAKLPSDSLLVIVQPHPLNVPMQLEKSVLWRRLPFSQPSNQVVLPPVWSFGALPSMQRFSSALTDALMGKQVTPW